MNTMPITPDGMKKLQLELEHLKKEARPAIIEAIAEAREHGDLKENAEYHAAKERQSFVEGRIMHLEHVVSSSQIIDLNQLPKDGKVVFGTTVTIINLDTDREVRYTLVGHEEADIADHKLSIASPLAKALVGHYQGDEVEVQTPDDSTAYEIIRVDYELSS